MNPDAQFRRKIAAHYRKHGRHTLPWRKTDDPYAIIVSEIMLQQTQVSRVEGYYEKFLKKFPSFAALAKAPVGEVLAAWQGLGYNRRALALQNLAKIVVQEHGGVLPRARGDLERLPGIGKGTSGSVAAFAFNVPEIFIETNIRRVFIHFYFPRAKKVTDADLERYIERTLDRKNPREWYWALMDYGAAMAKMPGRSAAKENPNRKSAHYRKQSAFKGSDREVRGKILRYLLARKQSAAKNRTGVDARTLAEAVGAPSSNAFEKIVSRLGKEGFIMEKGGLIYINNK